MKRTIHRRVLPGNSALSLGFLLLSIIPLLLSGCATGSISNPPDYGGPNHQPYDPDPVFSLREVPDEREYPLFPPDMNYRYFSGISRFPFEPEASDYSSRNAWILADAAFLAYCHPGFARMAYELGGFGKFHFIRGGDMEAAVVWNDSFIIISFRGTELQSLSTPSELFTDFNAFPVPFSHGGKVHQGFLSAFDQLWYGKHGIADFIARLGVLKPDRPVWITGHSLGGALATLCFARLPRAAGCYIYGAPRVGDEAFVSHFKDRQFYRFEYGNDPVTQVPFDLPALGFSYKDTGDLRYISHTGSVYDFYPWKSPQQQIEEAIQREKDRRSFQNRGRSPLDYRLRDHMPINYTVHLWNELLRESEREESDD